ncbi:hypothetical protein Tco_0957979 [Tanacetum coccineum]
MDSALRKPRQQHQLKHWKFKSGKEMSQGGTETVKIPPKGIADKLIDHYQDLGWYEALEDSELKEEALRNKAIMEGLIEEEDNDESRYEQRRQWNMYTNYEINHDVAEREELCEIHEFPVCNLRSFEMIKYSFGQDEEYVAIKEDEYNDLARISEDACRLYQEIFRMMDGN